MDRKEKTYRLLWVVTCALLPVTALVLYLTHRAVPFMMDDLWYATKLASEEPIRNLRDIVEAQIWHYNNWGGRSMTHGLLQLILLMGERAADCCNVLVTFLLAEVICLVAGGRFSGGRGERGLAALSGLLAAVGMLVGLNANWKMSMFWQAGAANYLYITVFLLLYLYCYLRELPEEPEESWEGFADGDGGEAGKAAGRRELPGITLWILPLGLLAGWSNENMGPAVWIVSTLVMAALWRRKRKLRPWMAFGNLACLAGSLLVIAAPGNFVRNAQVPENQYGVLWRLFLRGYAESAAALEYLFPTVLLTVFVLILGKGVLGLAVGRRNVLLLAAAFLSWGAMALSPHYPDRATFGTMTLLICVILSMSGRILRARKELFPMLYGVGALIWLRGMFFLGEFLAISWGWIR